VVRSVKHFLCGFFQGFEAQEAFAMYRVVVREFQAKDTWRLGLKAQGDMVLGAWRDLLEDQAVGSQAERSC
jgi:hypothetical protein